jgi:YVTN family beta-propeller protein
MDFRILGPLEVESDGRRLTLGPTKQRALLALLILRSNRVASRDELVDGLWGERPPDTATTALHGYVSGLRKTLGKERIETRSGGYLLHADSAEVDLERFQSLAAGARSLESRSAADQLRAALELWRGRPLADLDGTPFLHAERRRLEELRLGALEDRVDADLALGRQADLIAELDALVHEHPLRERVCGQLMLALYRSGRQAEALEVYQRHRRGLSDELGLEPGEALRRLEREILDQDPALGPVGPPAPPVETPRAQAVARRSRKIPRPRRALVASGLVLVVSAAAAAALLALLTRGSSGPAVPANSVAVIDPRTNRLVDDVPVGTRPVAIAVGAGSVWVANQVDRTVDRIDPKTHTVRDVVGIGTDVHDVAVGFGSVWVAGGTDGTVTRIDARSGRLLGKVTLGGGSPVPPVFWVAVGTDAVWATSGESLVRIDPVSGTIEGRIPLLAAPAGLGAGKAVWVVTQDRQLVEYTSRGALFQSASLTAPGLAPVGDAGSVWVIVYDGRGMVQPFAARTLAVQPPTETRAFPLDIAVGARSVWSVDVRGTVLRIDPATANPVARISTAPTLRSSIAVGAGAVWVAMQGT